MPDLTRKQRLALDIYRRNGELNEGMMADEGYPVIRQPRLVVNGLCARGRPAEHTIHWQTAHWQIPSKDDS